ncbi:MAG: hypothetical protein ABR568_22545, partial [Pyrinomonadaceae bacterium]
MTIDPVADELRSLIKQTEEQVAYFQELGVSGIAVEAVLPTETLKQPRSERAVKQAATVPATSQKDSLHDRSTPSPVTAQITPE